jgi:hypothetical protein
MESDPSLAVDGTHPSALMELEHTFATIDTDASGFVDLLQVRSFPSLDPLDSDILYV